MKKTKKVSSMKLSKASLSTIETMFTMWILYKGGIWDFDAIDELMGKSTHKNTTKRVIDVVEKLLHHPRELSRPVRCNRCGKPIMVVPCPYCLDMVAGVGRYREIKRATTFDET